MAVALLGGLAIVLTFLSWRLSREARTLRARYSGLTDIDSEIASRRRTAEAEFITARTKSESELAAIQARVDRLNEEVAHLATDLERKRAAAKLDLDAEITSIRRTAESSMQELQETRRKLESENAQRRAQLEAEYESALATYKDLRRQIALVDENLTDISFGLYSPHFTFQTPEEYKRRLEDIRERQRTLIRSRQAACCSVMWTVGNSQREGERMAKQYTKLLLRAFNGECDATVASVSWNNASKMEERIRKSFDALNDLGGVMRMYITPQFRDLKLQELWLAHEYEDKRYQDREEQRRAREELREEERATREIEKAREEADREEQRYERALQKAREEALQATGSQLAKLTTQIESLQVKLEEAHSRKERAISRAQLTKSGFVYVISNIGSFGERVVKVGMTRRMEPMERVAELGDASVPFPFDLHAMLYSDNTPELEAALHQLLADRRLNLVNSRKEFYRDVDIEEIEGFVRQRGLSAQFVKIPEARQYRETLAMRETREQGDAEERTGFAPALFTDCAGAAGASQNPS